MCWVIFRGEHWVDLGYETWVTNTTFREMRALANRWAWDTEEVEGGAAFLVTNEERRRLIRYCTKEV